MDPQIPTLNRDQVQERLKASKATAPVQPSVMPTPPMEGGVPTLNRNQVAEGFKAAKEYKPPEIDKDKIWEQNKRAASEQWVEPHVSMHYKNFLGEAEIDDADHVHIKNKDGSRTLTKKNEHVVLTDPADGKLKVYRRSPEVEVGPIKGRLVGISQELGPGLATGPVETGKAAITAAGRGIRVLGFGSQSTPEAGTAGRAAPAALRPDLEKQILDTAETGGSKIAQTVQRVEDVTGENIPVPRAVASDSPNVHRAGTAVSHLPFSGGPLRQGVEAMEEGVMRAADRVSEMPTGGPATPRHAGETVRESVEAYAHRDPDQGYLQGNVRKLFDNVKNSFTKKNTRHELADTTKIVEGIVKPYERTGTPIPPQLQELIDGPLAPGKALSYDDARFVATRLGQFIGDPSKLPAGSSVAELKQVYGGIKDDLRDLVNVAGGKKAVAALDRAFKYTELAGQRRQELHKFLGTSSDEALFAKIGDLASQTRRADLDMLRKVRKTMDQGEWNDISGAVLGRLGKNEAGHFDPSRYVRDWERISPEARTILVPNATTRKAVEDIVDIARKWPEARDMSHKGGSLHAAADLITASAVASPILLHAIQSGDLKHVLTAGAAMFGANFLARTFGSPVTAQSAAKWARRYNTFRVSPSSGTLQALNNATQSLNEHLTNKEDVK